MALRAFYKPLVLFFCHISYTKQNDSCVWKLNLEYEKR